MKLGALAEEHDLWVRQEDEEVVVGANRFVVAHGQFMVFYPRPCEIPVMREKSLGVMETAKTAVAISCPLSCVIVETNQAVQNDIQVVIDDPYRAGWLYRLRPIAWEEESSLLMPVAAACLMLIGFMFMTGLYLDFAK